jgi:HTH-type transcriptional regulator, competence development regulator
MAKSFGSSLRQYRQAAGISQRELAKKADLDFSYISKLENGRLPPPAADTVVLIAQILGVPAEELLALTGKIPSNIQETISTSANAQSFLREVQEMALTDDEWKKMVKSLKDLRAKK